MGSGRGIYLLIYQAGGITSVAYYFLFSQCPTSPRQAALVNVCWQQRLPWAGRWTWGLYVFIYPSICRCQGKGKVIFCVWPAGKTEANDLGHVDCYLALRIALYFSEEAPGNACGRDEKGWVGCLRVNECGGGGGEGGGVWVTGCVRRHTCTHRWRALNPGAKRSQVCGVIILSLRVCLLIMWII